MNQILIIILLIFRLISSKKYKNPVILENIPDPSIIKGDNNYYYLYGSYESIYRSLDLITWEYVGTAFEGKPRPSFADVDSYWAPCITKQNDIYILYFTLEDTGIGVATSNSPEIPFDIQNTNGKLFIREEIGINEICDPCFKEDEGVKYLNYWFYSLHIIFNSKLNY